MNTISLTHNRTMETTITTQLSWKDIDVNRSIQEQVIGRLANQFPGTDFSQATVSKPSGVRGGFKVKVTVPEQTQEQLTDNDT